MSEAKNPAAASEHESSEGLIRTPKQLIATIIAAFAVPVVVIMMMAHYVDFGMRTGAGSDGMSEQAVAQRLQRVGTVDLRDLSDASTQRSGEQVYTAVCSACHATGAVGAPKLGDAAAWAPRIATGYEALLHSALEGKGAMPKQGGGDFSDFEVARAVVYMADKAGAKFEEPKPPAAAASAPN
ncbi:MAG TPA: c-type cytochrome [Rubrivivax sp.]|jgi:cytochrome c5|nr:cytochrome c5 family protein [Pseudomonadota bacterium]HOL36679.1 c-type cytochrome [Rubrivivax sp.]HPP82946.1 c-type cytochrome [Rubrivivax sp.]